MAWGFFVALILLVAAPLRLGQRLHSKLGLQYSYDCGVQGMQLLVIPWPNQTIRFKVLDEFGNRFEVNNCSICYHWVISEPQETAVFSADYKGCHVLEKDGRFHLRVFMQAVLPNGHVDIGQDVTLICPKADHTGTPDPHLAPPTIPQPFSPHPNSGHTLAGSGHTLLSTLYPEHSFTHPTPASPSPGPGPAGPIVPHPQWGTLGPWELTTLDSVGTHLPQEQCQVASGHIPCMVKSSSKKACQQAGCCYDNTREVPCYYGNTATLQCFRSGYFTLVMSQETALTHRIMLDSVHLAYAPNGCPPTQKTSAFVVFHVPLTLCGTTIQVVGEQLIYENQLVSNINVQKGPQGSITRDSVFRFHIRCIFNASDFLPIQASIFSPQPPAPVTQSGPLRLELRIATDKTFSSYYQESDYPLVRLLQEPIHVEIHLLQRTDPNLVLVLHQCWATPTASPFEQPQWPILSDGCPFEGDNYRTQMVALDRAELPFQSHYQRFTIATFSLLDSSSQNALRGLPLICYTKGATVEACWCYLWSPPLGSVFWKQWCLVFPSASRSELQIGNNTVCNPHNGYGAAMILVYFFCSASVCSPEGTDTCSPGCDSGMMARHRRSSGRHNSTTQALDIVSSPGAVGFVDAAKLEPSGSRRNSSSSPLLWMLVLLLVLGSGTFVGLSWASTQKLQEGTRC